MKPLILLSIFNLHVSACLLNYKPIPYPVSSKNKSEIVDCGLSEVYSVTWNDGRVECFCDVVDSGVWVTRKVECR